MYKPTHLSWASIFLSAALISATAHAEETIYDPENPAVQTDQKTPSDDSDTGEETIFDPENPAVQDDQQTDDNTGQPRLVPVDDDESPASNATFLGHYATSLGVDTAWEGHGEDVVEWDNLLSLRLEYELPGHSRAVVEGIFRHWIVGQENPDEPNYLLNASHPRASYEPRLGEAYVLYRAGNWMFRAGNLVTPWGSTTIMRPGDLINPQDMTDIASSTGFLLPQLTGEVSYSTPTWAVTGLVVPFFEPNRMYVFGRDSALVSPFNPALGDQLSLIRVVEQVIDPSRWDDVQSFFTATRVPDETPKNASAGVRVTATRWNTDFGLGYFYGWDRTPWIEMDEDVQKLVDLTVADGKVLQDFDFAAFFGRHPEVLGITKRLGEKSKKGQTLFDGEYKRRHTVVANLSRYVGPIGVRADVAFTPQQTLYSDSFDPLRRTTVFGALGLSWEHVKSEDDVFALTLEGFWLHPFARDSAVNDFFVNSDERGPEGAHLLLIGDEMYGVAGGLRWSVPVIGADLQVGAVSTLSNEDVVGTASLSREWYSWLRTTLGVALYEGPTPTKGQMSLGGVYDHNDQVRLSVGGVF